MRIGFVGTFAAGGAEIDRPGIGRLVAVNAGLGPDRWP